MPWGCSAIGPFVVVGPFIVVGLIFWGAVPLTLFVVVLLFPVVGPAGPCPFVLAAVGPREGGCTDLSLWAIAATPLTSGRVVLAVLLLATGVLGVLLPAASPSLALLGSPIVVLPPAAVACCCIGDCCAGAPILLGPVGGIPGLDPGVGGRAPVFGGGDAGGGPRDEGAVLPPT